MPGLWERIKQHAEDRLGNHFLEAALILHSTDNFSTTKILNGLNSTVREPLTPAEEADVIALIAVLDAQGSVTNRLVYLAKMGAWGIAAEVGVVSETQYREALGI